MYGKTVSLGFVFRYGFQTLYGRSSYSSFLISVNGNGVQDDGEPGLSGLQLQMVLRNMDPVPQTGDGTFNDILTTGEDGKVLFTGVPKTINYRYDYQLLATNIQSTHTKTLTFAFLASQSENAEHARERGRD